MAAASRVFAARLAGLPVFGPDGESIGKTRDIVIGLRSDQQPPRALGIIVELPSRRRIFVPALRVTSIEPDAITLASGSVNLSRFHQRSNEMLIIKQLLNTKATLVSSNGAPVVIIDAAMEPDPSRRRDWRFTQVAVRGRGGLLGRRGPVEVVRWADVRLGPEEPHGGRADLRQLLAEIDTMRPADVARTLHALPAERRYAVADALADERLAEVIEELPDGDQRQLLTYLDEDRAADILEAMDPDDAADLLAELAEPIQNRLLTLMRPTESAPVRRLLQYPPSSAGGLMTPEPVVLPADATIAEALARIRASDLTPALASTVFVCRPPWATPTGHYLGCAHFQRLLREPPSGAVGDVVDVDLARLSPTHSLGDVTRYFAAYNLVCGPVVDDQEHLLGAVTVDDVLDHLLPSDWRETGLPDNQPVGQERHRD